MRLYTGFVMDGHILGFFGKKWRHWAFRRGANVANCTCTVHRKLYNKLSMVVQNVFFWLSKVDKSVFTWFHQQRNVNTALKYNLPCQHNSLMYNFDILTWSDNLKLNIYIGLHWTDMENLSSHTTFWRNVLEKLWLIKVWKNQVF